MTALPAVKREALRFRIWQFAAPREWDVTIAEIAEALGVHWMTVRNVLTHAGWGNRVRIASSEKDGFGGHNAGKLISDRHVIADVLAGRVNSEFPA